MRANVGFKSETDGYSNDDGHRQRISVNGVAFLSEDPRTLVGKRCEASGDEFWGSLSPNHQGDKVKWKANRQN